MKYKNKKPRNKKYRFLRRGYYGEGKQRIRRCIDLDHKRQVLECVDIVGIKPKNQF